MSLVRELITQLCPHGVEFARLGEVVRIRNGKDHKSLAVGQIPVYGTGGVMLYVDTAAHTGPSVLIPRKGSLNKLYYVNEPFWTVDTIFYTEIGDRLVPKFFYYYLLTQRLEELNQAGGVPSLTQSVLNLLPVPVPPLEVQREIVRILDQFTLLEAELEGELEGELEARRHQYEHYRHELLSFEANIPTRDLKDMAENLDKRRKPVERGARTPGSIPYYGASGIVDFVSDFIFEGDYLLVSEDGANLLARSTPIAFSVSGKTWVNNHAHVLRFESYAERRFVEIYLNSIDLSPFISGAAQPKLNKVNLNRIPIPDPPFVEKERLVSVLDKFNALLSDLSVGLPAELAARRKQYEYYRDQLLTFEEAPA